ncbi:MAG: SDR family oxidoreductase [Xanthobacteraceae bacterium]|nr:SDR family oxidoreductase [Xanthobacteraceae bacterium]
MNTLVCFGFGTCARHFVAEFGTRFARVVGTTRDPHKIAAEPVELLMFEGSYRSDELDKAIAQASHLLISAAPGEAGDPVLAELRDQIAAAPNLQSIVYLSSTGVYGDHAGAWVDETTATVPAHARGGARVKAEQDWQALARTRRVPVAVLRLGGIYGPGQNAFVRLRAGRAHRIDKPGHVSNRIHVADIAQAIDAVFTRRFDGVVNVTDGAPASPNEQIEYAATLLGIEPPPLLPFDEAKRRLSPFLMSFYEGCARVRNERLKQELGVTLRYPDYRAGLKALLAAGFEAEPL